MSNILAIEKSKLSSACSTLKVSPLDDEEYRFLGEYHSVIKLVSIALKSVESDNYTFALYLPTLIGLKTKLQAMIDNKTTIVCTPLVQALLRGLESRFGNLMDPFGPDGKSVPIFVAMLTNPKFKLNFLGMKKIEPRLLSRLKEMLLSEAIKVDNMIQVGNNDDENIDGDLRDNAATHDSSEENKLLIENDVRIGDPWDQNVRITKEIDRYLCAKTSTHVEDGLNDFPIIRKLFLKFNCVRSSEAICERMFSYAGN